MEVWNIKGKTIPLALRIWRGSISHSKEQHRLRLKHWAKAMLALEKQLIPLVPPFLLLSIDDVMAFVTPCGDTAGVKNLAKHPEDEL